MLAVSSLSISGTFFLFFSCGLFMRKVCVPVTFIKDPELIRPSIPVMTHSLNQKVMARKAKARKCTAEVVGNIQAKVEKKHRLVIYFSVIPPARNNLQRYIKMYKS
jgi:hypothetical protein